MIKSIYKISSLILGLLLFSSANAQTCKQENNNQPFDHATIWKTDHVVYCYYCSNDRCPSSYYIMDNYEPKDGPWIQDDLIWFCRSTSTNDCRFKKLSK